MLSILLFIERKKLEIRRPVLNFEVEDPSRDAYLRVTGSVISKFGIPGSELEIPVLMKENSYFIAYFQDIRKVISFIA